ncbi:TorF family putative porin [Synoicihabitans lomoniglobus]|uniref:TorF family putative porin n=1 Tax=Synoicihabitans lomoniglobus TaxID=2909285 RepID=A0AAF0CN80_9BACT|nr:TorF family putative porin [Opitutaceae bacterium LMO-M01]WED65163.1 TorF family putative porin [Opitutaceae bacterium LMO-M01]
MKIKLLFISALAVGATSLSAASSNYSITMDFPYVSDYVFRGVKYADDSIQPSIEFGADNFYAGIWSNQPVTGRTTNEFDFYAGYKFDLTDTWSMDVGATYYYYPETSSLDEQFEPYVGLTGDLLPGLTSTFYAYYETEFEALTLQGSLGYGFELSNTLTLNLAGNLGSVSASGAGDYTYWLLSATVDAKLNDHANAYLGVSYSSNDMDRAPANSLGGEYTYLTTGISIGF